MTSALHCIDAVNLMCMYLTVGLNLHINIKSVFDYRFKGPHYMFPNESFTECQILSENETEPCWEIYDCIPGVMGQ